MSLSEPHALGMADAGEQVRFLGCNGYPYELNEAKVCFDDGQILTVADVRIGDWSSSYRFEGRGDARWNTVMFEPLASADRSPEGQDPEEGLDAKHESAVPEADAQTQPGPSQ